MPHGKPSGFLSSITHLEFHCSRKVPRTETPTTAGWSAISNEHGIEIQDCVLNLTIWRLNS